MAVTMESELPVEPQSLKKLSFKSLKRALDLFSPLNGQFPPPDPASKKIRMNHKLNAEYGGIGSTTVQPPNHANSAVQKVPQASTTLALTDSESSRDPQKGVTQNELVVVPSIQPKGLGDTIFAGKSTTIIPAHETSQLLPSWKEFQADGRVLYGVLHGETTGNVSTAALMERIPSRWPRPVWRPPWRNYRVISGHLGWVRSVAFDPSNEWFCTGSADRTIKIWDVATGTLRLTLTGHIEQVRGLAVSTKHTYMFSAGDDKQVKCWDLEQNKVIRSYHGHLSGVFCLALHPTIDVLLTGGRDSVCRVWDIRSKMQIHVLSGHDNIVCSVFTRPTDPQVVTGSHDTTIKFWDLRYVAGKTMVTLTHHKKSVRAMAQHPIEDCFASASADNVKKFNLPKGEFLHNMLSQQKAIINAMAVNEDGVMVTGGDNGSMWFWDWKSGHNFQRSQTIVQPGSLDSEAGIYATSFDHTGTMLVTCEADKTIKMWKEDPNATPETHPLNFKPPKEIRRF